MIYRSNLIAPDLESQFRDTTICKVRPWSMGHSVLSDKDFEPDCCFMTHDEAAILYNVALASNTLENREFGRQWVDIGARFGWTAAHINAATHLQVDCVDQHFSVNSKLSRWRKNTAFPITWTWNQTSERFLASFQARPGRGMRWTGFCIDGNHDSPEPLNDASGALALLAPTGVIVFHDFWGQPIRDGVRYLMQQGLKCRVYNTPAGMAVCWRGDFTPPDHVADPSIDWVQVRINRAPEFDWSAVGGV